MIGWQIYSFSHVEGIAEERYLKSFHQKKAEGRSESKDLSNIEGSTLNTIPEIGTD